MRSLHPNVGQKRNRPITIACATSLISTPQHGTGHWTGTFDIPYTGSDPERLLTGRTYLNFHSSAFPNGKMRGPISASDETPATRLTHTASRDNLGPIASGSDFARLAGPAHQPKRIRPVARSPTRKLHRAGYRSE